MTTGSDKIVKLSIPTGTEPVSDLVAILEGLLARAKTGELRGLAYASVADVRCDTSGTGWAGGNGTRMPLAAAIMMLNARYSHELQYGD